MVKRFLLGVILFIYIIIFLFSACTHLTKKQPHINHVQKMEKILPKGSFLPYENFIYIEKDVYSNLLDKSFCMPFENSTNCQLTSYGTGSGIAIDHKDDTVFFLTAHHVCKESKEEMFNLFFEDKKGNYRYPNFKIKAHFYGKEYDARIVNYDFENDLCLLALESEFAYKTRKVKIAKNSPQIGDPIYMMSAPVSMYSDTTRFEFQGKFSGCNQFIYLNYDFCYFTIPSAPGSSGSGVFNEKGELISILSISLAPFPEISAGSKINFIRRLIK